MGEAVLVGFASATYTWQSVMLCAGLTAGIFAGLTIYAFTAKADFTGSGPMLFGALLVLGALGVPIAWGIMLYDLVGVLVFVGYIVHDTQLIIGGEHKAHQFTVDDYVFAALNIYLDLMRLFLHVLRLLGRKRK